MKKSLKNCAYKMLMLFVCAIIMSLSIAAAGKISVKAEDNIQPAKDLYFGKDTVYFTAASDGFYTTYLYYGKDKPEETFIYRRNDFSLKAGDVWKFGISASQAENPGYYTVYVACSKNHMMLDDLDKVKKRSDCTYTSVTVKITERMQQPSNVQLYPIKKGKAQYYRISWDKDNDAHAFYTPMISIGFYLKDETYYDIPAWYCYSAGKILVRTLSSDISKYIASKAVILDAPGVEGTEFIDEDTYWEIRRQQEEEKKKETEEKKKEAEAVGSDSLIVTNFMVDGITYAVNEDGNAIVTGIGNISKAVINEVSFNEKIYPVIGIAPGACKNNKTIKNLSIGSNVCKIGKKAFYKCKKLKKIQITVNKSLKIEKNAFKKVGKGATISVKGIKGKTKKKLIKKLSKQTNAVVK